MGCILLIPSELGFQNPSKGLYRKRLQQPRIFFLSVTSIITIAEKSPVGDPEAVSTPATYVLYFFKRFIILPANSLIMTYLKSDGEKFLA